MAQSMNFSNIFFGSTVYNTQQISAEQIPDPPTLFGYFPLSETIVGRDQDVEVLLRMVEDHHKVVITGIGGIGKTTLASLCVNRWVYNNKFKHAVLVNVETDVSLKNDFQALAKKIFRTTDKTSTEIYEHYNTLKGKTIFVLDNIVANYNITKYLPHENLTNIFVLGTSQYTEFRRIFHVYTLDKLSIDSSVDMIRKVLLNNEISIDIDENETELITDLAEKLDCHPLALEHAAAYIVDCTLYGGMSVLTSVQHYIKTLSERLEEQPFFGHPTEYRTPVHTALEMNIAKATSKCEDARKFLFCLSYLDPTGIHIAIFYQDPDFNRERIQAPIRELKKYSIISVNGNYISLSKLTQTVYRDLIKKEDTENNYMLDLLSVLFYSEGRYVDHHCNYLIQNLNIDKETMSTLYMRAFHSNEAIINRLTARLRLINCDMEDIKDWSALHYCVFVGHETFFKYFDTSEHGSRDDRMERFASNTWTIFDVLIVKDSKIYLFYNSIFTRHIDLISFFKRNKNQKNKKIIKGLTTMHLCAAFNIDKDDFSKLIKIGCDVNIRDDRGMTPILYAARYIAYNLVFRLHRAGATYDKNMKYRKPYKKLLSAASNNKHKSVLALLRKSDIDCTESDFSKTLLHWAVNKKHCELALELIKRDTTINGTDSKGNTPLLVATKKGLSEVVRELLKRGANNETIINNGDTPLLLAIRRGLQEVAGDLLSSGAYIETSNNDGDTPLLVAIRRGRSEIVAALLDRDANIETSNKDGDTALLVAIRRGSSKIIDELLNRDANIETRNNAGDTPLLVAAKQGYSKIVDRLLNRDANIQTINNAGATPLSVAAWQGKRKVVVKLLNCGADIETSNNAGDTPLLVAAGQGNSKVVAKLLHRGAKIETSNKAGDTPLLVAARWGRSDVVVELLRRKANMEATDNNGNTPLLVAVWEGHIEVALELLRGKANIDAINNDGYTPLIAAAEEGLGEVVIELLRLHANINIKNKRGETALLIAKREKHHIVVKLLKKYMIKTSDATIKCRDVSKH